MQYNKEEVSLVVTECIQSLDFASWAKFDAGMLKPEDRIRELCIENKCGNYNAHYMCPPFIETPEDIKTRLGNFKHGIMLQYVRPLDVKNDMHGLKQTKKEFHEKILQLETCLTYKGLHHTWALIGGSCELCEPCYAVSGEPCPFPDKARTSLVALGIDVISLLKRLSMDSEFHQDRITWTGCILF